jgi:hypothetical protein
MLSMGYPDYEYQPWSLQRRIRFARRSDRTFVDFLTVAQRALAELRRPLKSDYRCVGWAGYRSAPYKQTLPSRAFRVWIDIYDGRLRASGQRRASPKTVAKRIWLGQMKDWNSINGPSVLEITPIKQKKLLAYAGAE